MHFKNFYYSLLIILPLTACVLLLSSAWLWPQEKPKTGRKPVLIRADPDEKETEEEVIVHDPVQAKKSVEIGDFYLKRKNYAAAESRFREAIEYNLKWEVSYNKLISVLEKQDRYQEAIEVCLRFISNNPDSRKIKNFKKKEAKLKQKLP